MGLGDEQQGAHSHTASWAKEMMVSLQWAARALENYWLHFPLDSLKWAMGVKPPLLIKFAQSRYTSFHC